MVLIGIIIAVFIPEIAIKLIGVSVSLLGVVVLLMKLTTRLSSSVESKFKTNPPPNFKITVKKSPEAVRQTIENFNEDDEIDDIETSMKREPLSSTPSKNSETKDTMGDEEGFRIIKKEVKNEEVPLEVEPQASIKESVVEETAKAIETEVVPEKNYQSNQNISSNRFRKREIEIPLQGLLEEMPLLKDHPDQEFEFLINRILMAIRAVSNTRTSAFFFYNEHKGELILNSYASDSKRLVGLKTKFISSNDIVSQIAKSMKPEILSDINPAAEIDLLPYYRTNAGTNSFIGIPVIYDKNVIGVLTADSKHSDAYDTVMVNFLSHFAKMISGLIRSYSDKYDLVQDSKYFNLLNKFDNLVSVQNEKKIMDELTDCIFSTFNCENVYTIELNEANNKYKVISIAKPDISNFSEGYEFYNNNSVLTEAIETNTDIFLSKVENDVVRINSDEKSTGGYFYVLPISTNFETYGALAVEGKIRTLLDKSEQSFIKTIVKKCGKLIENQQLINMIDAGFDRDPESGLLTSSAIENEVGKEIKRVSHYNYNSSVISISFDKYKSFEGANKYTDDLILNHINHFVEPMLEELDIKGRQDDKLVVILSGKNSQSSKLWAERVRSKIASEALLLSDKKYNVTVSIGICEIRPNSSCNEIMNNTYNALEVSKQKSNTVSVFS